MIMDENRKKMIRDLAGIVKDIGRIGRCIGCGLEPMPNDGPDLLRSADKLLDIIARLCDDVAADNCEYPGLRRD